MLCFLAAVAGLEGGWRTVVVWCAARSLVRRLLFAHLQVMRCVLFFALKSLGGLARIGWLGERGGGPIWAMRDPLF